MYQNTAKTFAKSHLAKFMLFYCLFLCDSLREARDRSNKGKRWIPVSVTLLPSISDHNSCLLCSSASWLSSSYSTFSMKSGSNSLEMRRSHFSVHVLHKCQSQPKHQPAPVSICCPACVPPALVIVGTMSWLCWWLTCGILWQRSHHFPCAYPTLTPAVILETPADSQRAFLTKLPT